MEMGGCCERPGREQRMGTRAECLMGLALSSLLDTTRLGRGMLL